MPKQRFLFSLLLLFLVTGTDTPAMPNRTCATDFSHSLCLSLYYLLSARQKDMQYRKLTMVHCNEGEEGKSVFFCLSSYSNSRRESESRSNDNSNNFLSVYEREENISFSNTCQTRKEQGKKEMKSDFSLNIPMSFPDSYQWAVNLNCHGHRNTYLFFFAFN